MKLFGIIALTAAMLTSVSARADSVLFTIQDSGWANSNVSTTAPESLVVAFGACVGVANCTAQYLPPIMFFPSGSTQSVTISGGTNFSNVVNAFESNQFVYEIAQRLSSDCATRLSSDRTSEWLRSRRLPRSQSHENCSYNRPFPVSAILILKSAGVRVATLVST
jgi:hypothetical protein